MWTAGVGQPLSGMYVRVRYEALASAPTRRLAAQRAQGAAAAGDEQAGECVAALGVDV